MTRFDKASMNILKLHPDVAMHSIKVVLRSGPFSDTLYVDLPIKMDNLKARVVRYISIEENAKERKRVKEQIKPHH